MITPIFLPVLFAISFGIRQKMEEHSSIQWLTQKTWTSVSYGYDYNNNNAIDIPEECITDCNKDDTYGFCADGTGLYSDNMLSCCNGFAELSFKWRSISTGIVVDFPTGTAIVQDITDEQLVVMTTGKTKSGQSLRRLQVFRH